MKNNTEKRYYLSDPFTGEILLETNSTKELQSRTNHLVETIYNDVFKEMQDTPAVWFKGEHVRLRTCNAYVFETENYFILQSYNTIVACITKDTDCLIDFLRFAYGYTNTSAQHIRKFEKDYCRGKWGCYYVYTWRQVK